MATSNIEKQSFGQAGAIIAIPATGAVADTFCALAFIEETVLSALTWAELDPGGDDGTTPTYPAGFVLYGEITGFTVGSGAVVAYKEW